MTEPLVRTLLSAACPECNGMRRVHYIHQDLGAPVELVCSSRGWHSRLATGQEIQALRRHATALLISAHQGELARRDVGGSGADIPGNPGRGLHLEGDLSDPLPEEQGVEASR